MALDCLAGRDGGGEVQSTTLLVVRNGTRLGVEGLAFNSGPPLVSHEPAAAYERASDDHGRLAVATATNRGGLGDRIRLIAGYCDPTVNLDNWYAVSAATASGTARGAVYRRSSSATSRRRENRLGVAASPLISRGRASRPGRAASSGPACPGPSPPGTLERSASDRMDRYDAAAALRRAPHGHPPTGNISKPSATAATTGRSKRSLPIARLMAISHTVAALTTISFVSLRIAARSGCTTRRGRSAQSRTCGSINSLTGPTRNTSAARAARARRNRRQRR